MGRKRGFTLIELMVVIAMVAILTAAGFTGYIFSIQKARDAQRKSDLATISKALEIFANDFGKYPIGWNGLIYACGPDVNGVLTACDWGGEMAAVVNGTKQIYLPKLPQDPDVSKSYVYEYTSGSVYVLCANLDNQNDPSANHTGCSGAQQWCGRDLSGTDLLCNYVRSSSGVE